jgi:hypothetical protein
MSTESDALLRWVNLTRQRGCKDNEHVQLRRCLSQEVEGPQQKPGTVRRTLHYTIEHLPIRNAGRDDISCDLNVLSTLIRSPHSCCPLGGALPLVVPVQCWPECSAPARAVLLVLLNAVPPPMAGASTAPKAVQTESNTYAIALCASAPCHSLLLLFPGALLSWVLVTDPVDFALLLLCGWFWRAGGGRRERAASTSLSLLSAWAARPGRLRRVRLARRLARALRRLEVPVRGREGAVGRDATD